MRTQVESTIAVDKQARIIAHEGLEERAMTMALHLRMWGGSRLDRETTREVLAEREAASDAGRFEKNLVPPSALRDVTKAHSHARSLHYSLTLPWDAGVRILSAPAFFDYVKAMGEERSVCELAHRDFCAAYPGYVDSAPVRLGKRLFELADFPSAKTIADRFGFEIVTLPIPTKADFRVDLGAEMQRRIQDSIEQTVTERYATAQRELWERLLETVKHFATTMADDEKTYRNSTVEKLGELARLAPKLSLTPDPKLEAICADILAITGGAAPSDFRENVLLRRESAARAKAALDKIEESMKGAFI